MANPVTYNKQRKQKKETSPNGRKQKKKETENCLAKQIVL